MRSRIFGLKRSTLLRVSLAVNLILAGGLILYSILVVKNYFLWFFIFCGFAGLHSLAKAFLFKLDSACYFGFLLLFLGIVGVISYLIPLPYKSLLLLISSGVASIVTFIFTKQKFQFYFGVLQVVSGSLGFIFCMGIVNLAVFLSIYSIFLFIFFFTCAILIYRYFKKVR